MDGTETEVSNVSFRCDSKLKKQAEMETVGSM